LAIHFITHLLRTTAMTADAKPPAGIERRSRERVADDADWETKVLARVRGKLRRGSSEVDVPASTDSSANAQPNWEEQVAAKIRERNKSPK
jgi:hypothetical protein